MFCEHNNKTSQEICHCGPSVELPSAPLIKDLLELMHIPTIKMVKFLEYYKHPKDVLEKGIYIHISKLPNPATILSLSVYFSRASYDMATLLL